MQHTHREIICNNISLSFILSSLSLSNAHAHTISLCSFFLDLHSLSHSLCISLLVFLSPSLSLCLLTVSLSLSILPPIHPPYTFHLYTGL